MNKSQHAEDNNIAGEQYKGPSAAITALGQGVIEHLKWAAIGIATFGTAALIRPSFANRIITSGRDFAAQLKTPLASDAGTMQKMMSSLKKTCGNLMHFILGEGKGAMSRPTIDPQYQAWLDQALNNKEGGFGHLFISHTVGALPFVGKNIKASMTKEPLASSLTFGGVGGVMGYVGGWLSALLGGHEQAHAAKDQFERAKNEVIKLRGENAEQLNDGTFRPAETDEPATPTTRVTQASLDTLEKPITPTTEPVTESTPTQPIAKEPVTKEPVKSDASWAADIQTQKASKAAAETAVA